MRLKIEELRLNWTRISMRSLVQKLALTLKKGMCLASLNQLQQTDFVMSFTTSSERLIARNIDNRYWF